MPNFPVRNLGGAGIISDIHPYDLPPNVFSAGVNVRFENGTVSRGPVMRDVFDITTYDNTIVPAYIFTIGAQSGSPESVVVVDTDYSTVTSIIGDTFTDVTPSVVVTGATGQPFTHAFLGGVAYLNRGNNLPKMKRAADADFVDLTNWNPLWKCNVLRAYKDFLIALNVTKSAVNNPQMVKWSDIALFGDEPPSWDETDPTTSAGENVLNEMRGEIIDGHVLRDTFMLYGENEVWAMNYIGGDFIFDFRKRFDDVGVISTNCVVEVDGRHYVFDRNDILVHDGTTKQSIVHGKNKDFIFNGLIRDLQNLCFVTHNPRLNEILFCYPSQDRLVGFENPSDGCNRAAAYNYRRDSWTFYDLPNATGATYAILANGLTYDSAEAATPYNQMGGTYAGDGNQIEKHQLFTSVASTPQGITKNRVVGADLVEGGRLNTTVITELLKDAFAERIGIDLDESGLSISSYKSLLKIYPQIAVSSGDGGVTFQFGANDVTAVSPAWDTPQPFDPETEYQLNVRRAGRYLAHRITHTGLSDFSYSGFDARLTTRGQR